jgi:hypothetical protein
MIFSNRYLTIILCTLLFSLISFNTSAQNEDTLYCYASSGLKLRTHPDLDADWTLKINFGENCQFLNKSDSTDELKVGYITGNWIKVRYHSDTGYVFDAYLSKYKFPGRHDGICHEFYGEILENYLAINDTFVGLPDTVMINDNDGEGLHRKITFNLKSGDIYEHHTFWEAHDFLYKSKKLSINDAINFINSLGEICNDLEWIKKTSPIYYLDNDGEIKHVKYKNYYDFDIYVKGDWIEISLKWGV